VSETHFFKKLFFAAPASFFSAAADSQVAVASDSHYFRKLVLAAPASFFSWAVTVQVAAKAFAEANARSKAAANAFIGAPKVGRRTAATRRT
jgi:hypothetical protein